MQFRGAAHVWDAEQEFVVPILRFAVTAATCNEPEFTDKDMAAFVDLYRLAS